MLSGSGRDFLGDNRLPDWCKRNSRQFQVLDGKRDADDCAEAQEGGDNMADGKPDPSKDEPDYVPDHAQSARTDVVLIRQFFAANRFFSKGEECELSNDEASLAPRDADDRDEGQQTGKPPSEAHEDATQDEPQEITDCAHCCGSICAVSHVPSLKATGVVGIGTATNNSAPNRPVKVAVSLDDGISDSPRMLTHVSIGRQRLGLPIPRNALQRRRTLHLIYSIRSLLESLHLPTLSFQLFFYFFKSVDDVSHIGLLTLLKKLHLNQFI